MDSFQVARGVLEKAFEWTITEMEEVKNLGVVNKVYIASHSGGNYPKVILRLGSDYEHYCNEMACLKYLNTYAKIPVPQVLSIGGTFLFPKAFSPYPSFH
mgnify:FL=1